VGRHPEKTFIIVAKSAIFALNTQIDEVLSIMACARDKCRPQSIDRSFRAISGIAFASTSSSAFFSAD
jgi:hypothetical protein